MATLDDAAQMALELPEVAFSKKALRDALIDGWLACAPPSLAEQYLKRG